jgi:hypothetical protein
VYFRAVGKVTEVGRWISVNVWSFAYFGELSWSKIAGIS